VRILALLLAVSAPLVARAEPKVPFDEDFDAEESVPSLALGPVPRGHMVAGLDVGWLRSDLQAQLGLGYWIDITFRAESMTLYQGFNAQNSVQAGARISPFSEGLFRLSFALEGGEVFAPVSGGTKSFPLVRGEVSTGLVLEALTLYGRVALRGAASDSVFVNRWAQDTEAGIGLEAHAAKRLVLGVEGFAWGRQRSETLWQWRIRVGWAI
jgi:hypothetical protein